MSLNLDDFASLGAEQESGIEVTILHPKTGEPTDMVVKVAGPDSAMAKKARSELAQKRIDMKVRKLSLSQIEADNIELLAKCTIDWRGFEVGKQPLPLSVENAKMVYTKHAWLREQVDAVAGDRANFIKT